MGYGVVIWCRTTDYMSSLEAPFHLHIYYTRSLEARWALTSRPPARTPDPPSPGPGPALGPSGLLDFVFHALRALKPCDSKKNTKK